MKNFSKSGYSVPEVSQILHCTPATVRSYIAKGELEAILYPTELIPGKKRQIRITKAQLQNYMRKYSGRFSEEELKAFGVNNTSKGAYEPQEDPESDQFNGCAKPLDDITGAWREAAQQALAFGMKLQEQEHLSETPEATIDAYSIKIDGRISVGNVSLATATAIVNALLTDNQISFTSIAIMKGVYYK